MEHPRRPDLRSAVAKRAAAHLKTADGPVLDHLDAFDKLRSMHPETNPANFKYPGNMALVKAFGRQYHIEDLAPEELEGIPHGSLGECFLNALKAVHENPMLTYVEGYAQGSILPVHHAWVTDDGRRAIDVTWHHIGGGQDYYGIPFTREFVFRRAVETGYSGVMSDVSPEEWYRDGFPPGAIER